MDHLKTVILILLIFGAGMWVNRKWPALLSSVPVVG